MGADGRVYRLTSEEAVSRCADVLKSVGADDDTANIQAHHLVEAELRGHPSHGLRRLQMLVDRVRAGLIDPNAYPRFEWTADASLRVDGERGFGPVSAYGAIAELSARVQSSGVAVAAMRR